MVVHVGLPDPVSLRARGDRCAPRGRHRPHCLPVYKRASGGGHRAARGRVVWAVRVRVWWQGQGQGRAHTHARPQTSAHTHTRPSARAHCCADVTAPASRGARGEAGTRPARDAGYASCVCCCVCASVQFLIVVRCVCCCVCRCLCVCLCARARLCVCFPLTGRPPARPWARRRVPPPFPGSGLVHTGRGEGSVCRHRSAHAHPRPITQNSDRTPTRCPHASHRTAVETRHSRPAAACASGGDPRDESARRGECWRANASCARPRARV